MQWSTAVDIVAGELIETDYVACRSLKCEERNKRYLQPTVELVSFEQDEKNKAEAEAYQEDQEYEAPDSSAQDLVTATAAIAVAAQAVAEPRTKRKYTRKDVKG
jgi:hypothetical protein